MGQPNLRTVSYENYQADHLTSKPFILIFCFYPTFIRHESVKILRNQCKIQVELLTILKINLSFRFDIIYFGSNTLFFSAKLLCKVCRFFEIELENVYIAFFILHLGFCFDTMYLTPILILYYPSYRIRKIL